MFVSHLQWKVPSIVIMFLYHVISACRIRVPYPFQWGAPTFDAGEAFAMMFASFVALVEVCLFVAILEEIIR